MKGNKARQQNNHLRFKKKESFKVSHKKTCKPNLTKDPEEYQSSEEEEEVDEVDTADMNSKLGDTTMKENLSVENNGKKAPRTLLDYMNDIKTREEEFENRNVFEQTKGGIFTDKSAKAYYKEFKKVVAAADIVLEVLDARDPEGSRCPTMEKLVRSYPKKKLVLMLNKADLVPKEILEKWLKYLKQYAPTLLFKASTQCQANNLAQLNRKVPLQNQSFNTSKCVGADHLMQLLKNYSRNCGIKTAIVVGVVGMPNVGKSSLINSLKRSKACNVGATPGVTKTLQEIILDSKVRLLDCPGVVLPGPNNSDASASLRNVLKIEDLDDPITPVQAILDKAGKTNLQNYYGLKCFNNIDEFLYQLARARNLLLKGAHPNVNAAARLVLGDWNTGKIKYYTIPPEIDNSKFMVSSSIVTNIGKEFNFDEMDVQENLEEAVEKEMEEETMDTTPSCSQNGILPANVEIDLSKKEEEEAPKAEKKERWETEAQEVDFSNLNFKKLQKKMQKKQRKERARNVKRTDDLADAFQLNL